MLLFCTLIGTACTSSCAGWQLKTETVASKAAAWGKEFRQVSLPMLNGTCRNIAENCAADADRKCPAWHKCNGFRKQLERALIALQYAALDAKQAALIGKEKEASRAVEAALDLVQMIITQMRDVGMFPGEMSDGEE